MLAGEPLLNVIPTKPKEEVVQRVLSEIGAIQEAVTESINDGLDVVVIYGIEGNISRISDEQMDWGTLHGMLSHKLIEKYPSLQDRTVITDPQQDPLKATHELAMHAARGFEGAENIIARCCAVHEQMQLSEGIDIEFNPFLIHGLVELVGQYPDNVRLAAWTNYTTGTAQRILVASSSITPELANDTVVIAGVDTNEGYPFKPGVGGFYAIEEQLRAQGVDITKQAVVMVGSSMNDSRALDLAMKSISSQRRIRVRHDYIPHTYFAD